MPYFPPCDLQHADVEILPHNFVAGSDANVSDCLGKAARQS
jgi:hypothetical protein